MQLQMQVSGKDIKIIGKVEDRMTQVKIKMLIKMLKQKGKIGI